MSSMKIVLCEFNLLTADFDASALFNRGLKNSGKEIEISTEKNIKNRNSHILIL
jgi:hypothetical protein